MITYLKNWKNAHQLEILLFVIVLILLVTIIMKLKFTKRQFERYGLVMSCLYILVIFYVTVLSRETDTVFIYNHELFWSYKLALSDEGYLAEIGLNILLFVPLGIIEAAMVERRKQYMYGVMIVLAGMISACIELLQYNFKCGFSEIDDIVSNALGVIFGIVLWKSVQKFQVTINKMQMK